MKTAAVGQLGEAGAQMSLRRTQFLLFYTYFGFGTVLQVFPPLLGILQREFGINHGTASLVMSLFLAPFVLTAIPAGMAADRFGVAWAGRAGGAVMLAGTLVTLLAGSWPLVLTGRAIAGAGGGFLLVSALKVGTETIPRDKLGISLGLFAAGLPVGTGVSFNVLRLVAESTGWKGALAGALVTLASTLLLFELITGRRSLGSRLSVNPARALGSAELWRLSAITVLGYAAILGFTTWAPTTLVGFAGIPLWGASLIASLLLVIDIPFAPMWGAVSDRMGRRRPFVILAFAVYLLGSLMVPFLAQTQSVAALVLTIAGMGIGCAMFFPAALTIPAETVTPDRAGAAYGLFFTAQVAGMLVGPMTIGQILDAATPLLAFLSVSAITAGGLALAFTLRSR